LPAGTTAINLSIEALDAARDTLRVNSTALSNKLSTVTIRQDFTDRMINTLEDGAANLTNADLNEEGANLLMLQTRQSLGTTSLSMASQAAQAVLEIVLTKGDWTLLANLITSQNNVEGEFLPFHRLDAHKVNSHIYLDYNPHPVLFPNIKRFHWTNSHVLKASSLIVEFSADLRTKNRKKPSISPSLFCIDADKLIIVSKDDGNTDRFAGKHLNQHPRREHHLPYITERISILPWA
jgi:hypothetical protein